MLSISEYSENFEQWCLDCVRIYDKITGASVPFRLNAPQRRVAALMENRRRAGLPIRIIMLKARQWGGSTLTQIYMAWMQIVRRKGWNSLICSHVKDASANIRGIYSHLLRNYPEELRGSAIDPRQWVFTPFERSSNIYYVPSRDCRVAVTSAHAPDAVRGGSYQMAHLSEVAFWGDGDSEAAARIVRTVGGSIPLEPDTVVVMESTADGTDNFFHREWLRAVKGESDKIPVFVPWYEIEIYSLRLSDEERAAWPAKFDDYELSLLHHKGLSVEKVAWYHCKRREYASHEQMMAEYPSTPEEAFANVSEPWLSAAESDMLRIAAPEESDREPTAAVVIMLPPLRRGGESIIATARRYTSGEVAVSQVLTIDGDLREAINAMATAAKTENADCCVIRRADSDITHRWLDNILRKEGINPVNCLPSRDCSDEETGCTTLSPGAIAELRDCWHELVVSRRWIEQREADCKALRSLKAAEAAESSAVLVRLAAAGVLYSPDTQGTKLSPIDFF